MSFSWLSDVFLIASWVIFDVTTEWGIVEYFLRILLVSRPNKAANECFFWVYFDSNCIWALILGALVAGLESIHGTESFLFCFVARKLCNIYIAAIVIMKLIKLKNFTK